MAASSFSCWNRKPSSSTSSFIGGSRECPAIEAAWKVHPDTNGHQCFWTNKVHCSYRSLLSLVKGHRNLWRWCVRWERWDVNYFFWSSSKSWLRDWVPFASSSHIISIWSKRSCPSRALEASEHTIQGFR